MRIIAQAPMRISFAGGGTDLSPFTERYGGEVVSATIDKYCRAELSLNTGQAVRIATNRRDEVLDYPNWKTWPEPDGHLDFIKRLYIATHGHAGFSGGFELGLHSDSPTRGGLGSSGAMGIAILWGFALANSASQGLLGNLSPHALWRIAYEAELSVGNKTGRQDHCAAAFGGFNHFEWRKPTFLRNPVQFMDEQARQEIADSVLLFELDERPNSGSHIQADNSRRIGNGKNTKALLMMKAEVPAMRCALRIGDFHTVGKILQSQWALKRTCSGQITNNRIDAIFRELKRVGMLGGKVTGAGGGGHMIACCEPQMREHVLCSGAQMGIKHVPFQFSDKGVTVRWE